MPKVSPDYLQARREQILAAAGARFARDGFHRTSMQDVIDEAGLSPGAVYRYFTSKDEIIRAISLEATTMVEAAVRDALHAPQSVPELLERLPMILAEQDHLDDRTRLAVQAWGEALRSTPIAEGLQDGLDGVRTALADRLRAGQHCGEVDAEVDPVATAEVLLGVLQGFILQRSWTPGLDAAGYGHAARCLAAGALNAAERAKR